MVAVFRGSKAPRQDTTATKYSRRILPVIDISSHIQLGFASPYAKLSLQRLPVIRLRRYVFPAACLSRTFVRCRRAPASGRDLSGAICSLVA
jgi:hypothetical protein